MTYSSKETIEPRLAQLGSNWDKQSKIRATSQPIKKQKTGDLCAYFNDYNVNFLTQSGNNQPLIPKIMGLVTRRLNTILTILCHFLHIYV